MTVKNFLNFIFQPKSYITKVIETRLHNRMVYHHYFSIDDTKEQDVFLAGYPKSGNTWLQNIITGLILNMDTNNLSDLLSQTIVPDVHNSKFYQRFYKTMYFKTHHLPLPNYQKVIHLVRDGRDVLWSYYQMHLNMNKLITLQEIVIKDKGLFPCSWQEHTRAWLDNPYEAKILRIRYELLLNDPLSELKKICEFVELERTEKDLRIIMEGNSFQQMKKKEEIFGKYNVHFNPKGNFLRKGITGNYKSGFSPELLEKFQELAGEELIELNYL